MIKPLGFYVLIEMDTIEDVSAGGIILGDVRREQDACEFGTVEAIGPIAYKGFEGCEGSDDWGVKVGDRVEYRSYEGKRSGVKDMENFTYTPDSHNIGVVSD